MKNIAIIPARGGSKRIPRKNIRPFLGKPIISYSISAAKECGLFGEVMVSTDDPEIAHISLEYGAKVPFLRSAETANEYAGIADVLIEVLEQYEQEGVTVDNICCILATAPLIMPCELVEAYQSFVENGFESLYPIVAYPYPIQRSFIRNDQGMLTMCWPEHYNSRSQDLELTYHDSGTFYWIKSETLKRERKLLTSRTGSIVFDEIRVQDIDNEIDWQLAEIKYKLFNETS